MPLSGSVLTGIILSLFLQRNQERRQSADEPTIWELYQRRWRSWVDEMDINDEERQALIAQGFNGILASVDGTYGKADAQLCVLHSLPDRTRRMSSRAGMLCQDGRIGILHRVQENPWLEAARVRFSLPSKNIPHSGRTVISTQRSVSVHDGAGLVHDVVCRL